MLAYTLRRLIWMVPIVLGVVMLTFTLFALVAKDPARQYAGKRASAEELVAIRHKMGLDKPLWVNWAAYDRGVAGMTDSQFFDVLLFRFPESMRQQEPVWQIFVRKAPVSFSIQFPAFVVLVGIELMLALYVARMRGRWPDRLITLVAVFTMSVPILSIYLLCQWLFGAVLRWFPVAGWDRGITAIHFMALPILISILYGWGGGVRFYRTVVLEEISSDYVRTARAKGVTEGNTLLIHVMRNIMIQVLTSTVTALPGLFLGALFLERMFQIPGIGNLLVDSILNNDRPVVMFTTYVLSIVYAFLLLLTDILYTLADPRVSLR
jgi:peptide/nickel transport system permease protein